MVGIIWGFDTPARYPDFGKPARDHPYRVGKNWDGERKALPNGKSCKAIYFQSFWRSLPLTGAGSRFDSVTVGFREEPNGQSGQFATAEGNDPVFKSGGCLRQV
jgi:hypothetical protein